MKNPLHPGGLIKTEIIEAFGLSAARAAEILKVRRATLSELLRGKASLTPEMAQLAYDVAQTRKHARDISIKRYVPSLIDSTRSW